uniref:Uncharacterized protein n=1 Tax=Oryza brachyantha TaxID=4533 RepID=J3M6I5_ORYBR
MVTERRRVGVHRSISTKAMIAATRSPMKLKAASSSDSSVQHTLPMSADREDQEQALGGDRYGQWLGHHCQVSHGAIPF